MAIAEVSKEDGISLYFGCQQEHPEWGGAGLLKYLPDIGTPAIYTLRQSNNKVHAGMMFLAQTCDPNGGMLACGNTVLLSLGLMVFFVSKILS